MGSPVKKFEQKVWQQKYPAGVPFEINADAYPSIIEAFETACRTFALNPCFSNLGFTLSFADLEKQSRAFAAYLQSLPGVQPGDRIAIQLPNLLQYPIALFGALRAGLTVVNTNPLYTAREMENQFKDSGAKVIVICANFASHLEKILPRTEIQHVVVTQIGDVLPGLKRHLVNAVIRYVKKMVPHYHLPSAVAFPKALKIGAARNFQRVSRKGEDLAFIQYTGGTTGVSKGAMLTHRNIVANMEQVAAWLRPSLAEGADVCLTPLPLYHVFSLTANAMALFKYGTHNVLITNPRDIPSVIKEMKRYRLTLMTGVNTLFNALMNHPDFSKVDFSSLKICVGGAMALQKPVAERWHKMTGSLLVEGYGLTETSPVVCVNPLTKESVRVGTVGLVVPSTEVKLMTENGSEAAAGESGEVWVRGPQVMKGYWNKPEESRNVLPGNGWLRTGDVGEFNADGYLRIVDRQKDMISVSGFKVYPNEVEEVLVSHPKVLEAGVVGVPDEHSGEAVKAFVVKKDASLTESELKSFARENLTAYKIPKQIVFIAALPKTNVGKILRRELR
jgi:long-chain acyl-CoA synthetase